ncbi:hypothetical protein [Lewinella sp. IMCC34191]|uniref:hypothetical protein n=1 Tax=Lewinella sp. IMCC34191 TaxID=2259172 RepID=UPI000E222085|nr:hypothetical protein [Lewinella sp. IMCC34191]
MKNGYEERWRERMGEYAPAATDADWGAMSELLPKQRRGGKWRKPVLGVLLLAGTMTVWLLFAGRADQGISFFPVAVPMDRVVASPQSVDKALPIHSAETETNALLGEPATDKQPNPAALTVSDNMQPVISTGIVSQALRPSRPEVKVVPLLSLPPLPRLSPAYSVYDSLHINLPSIETESTSGSYYPTPIFDKH